MTEDHRLVVLGGGVAGLDIASHLAGQRTGNKRLAVTLVDRETAYVWKPMLHTIAAGTANVNLQETSYSAQACNCGFRYELGEAIGIDRHAREVKLAAILWNGNEIVPERKLLYDTLVLAVGSRANDFGTPGVAEHCSRIDTRSDAMVFNDRLRAYLLQGAASGRATAIGIVGGGATGVELAAELVQAAAVAERYGMAGASSRLDLTLVESGPRLLGPFPDKVAAAARAKLEQLGVAVRTGHRVTSVDAHSIRLDNGEVIPAALKAWAAGVKAPPLLDALSDLERTRTGQLVVGPTFAAKGDIHLYALGDCASPNLPNRDTPVPTTAQAASQHARYLCRYLPALINHETVPPASYHDFGALVSLGGFDAYGTLGRFGFFDGGFLHGRVAQLGHAMLYRSYQVRLHGFIKGSLLWLIDMMERRVRPKARLS